ncbi:MAG: HI0074 family nucleotidyltransferase substrate-binding subunit [Alphaproteobacteria bacterium]
MIDISAQEQAIERLKESLHYAASPLAQQDAGLARQFMASSIQAFEFTYELAHKMLKRYLEATEASPASIDAMSFQELIRTGAEKGLLQHSWDQWKHYRHFRSVTSHSYNEKKAEEVFEHIPAFLQEAEFLHDQIKKRQAGA